MQRQCTCEIWLDKYWGFNDSCQGLGITVHGFQLYLLSHSVFFMKGNMCFQLTSFISLLLVSKIEGLMAYFNFVLTSSFSFFPRCKCLMLK